MAKKVQYYKVVRVEGNRKLSALVTDKTWKQEYSTTGWTKALEKSGLFVFSTRKAARRWKHLWQTSSWQTSSRKLEIWKCTVSGAVTTPLTIIWPVSAPAKDYHSFWSDVRISGTVYLPADNTALFKRVKLTEKVS